MLKVLFPFVGDSVGGSHHSVVELHKELTRLNIFSRILVHKKGPLSLFLDSANIDYDYLPITHFAGDKPNIFLIIYNITINFFKISSYIRKNKVTIVHGNDLRINLTWSLPVKFSPSSYVWHQRALMSKSVLWRFSNILSDHFVAISRYVYQSLPDNVQKIKKTLVLNPFNIKNLHNKTVSRDWANDVYNIPENTILIGYAGRLIKWKNIDFLIQGFSECIKKSDIDLHLLIVGTGDSKYIDFLKNLTCKLKINNFVTFAGFSSNPNKVIASFDLMIAPSDNEPFGRTIVEAMLQRTPIIAAKGGGHLETIKNESTGWLYSHNNIENLCTTVECVLSKHEMRGDVIERAYLYAYSVYSSEKHVKNIINIYSQLK